MYGAPQTPGMNQFANFGGSPNPMMQQQQPNNMNPFVMTSPQQQQHQCRPSTACNANQGSGEICRSACSGNMCSPAMQRSTCSGNMSTMPAMNQMTMPANPNMNSMGAMNPMGSMNPYGNLQPVPVNIPPQNQMSPQQQTYGMPQQQQGFGSFQPPQMNQYPQQQPSNQMSYSMR